MWIIPMLALVFCLLGGRNDGSPLVAINLKVARRVTAIPFVMLSAAVALLPLANDRVGATVVADGDPRPGQADRGRLLLAAVLVAASATLLVLNGGGVPTSITLAWSARPPGWGSPEDSPTGTWCCASSG